MKSFFICGKIIQCTQAGSQVNISLFLSLSLVGIVILISEQSWFLQLSPFSSAILSVFIFLFFAAADLWCFVISCSSYLFVISFYGLILNS